MSHAPPKKEYHPPQLTVYGDVREITLSTTLANRKSDAALGRGSLKT